ncbi:saccharopine dehydrogenase C-terminal domain-containing protein [Pontibacter sp. G13]|uniref:saccharopine dehydrogenase family protein n=1 Tax=Pontibacter sp. G13 TaxID=3074898 RepID=UPI002889DEA9|nr:saccharopine dehydrogenase C-terminal domain-containing protein [Pontibacter sp. G13]WNJ21042.1 saccharopine dehydrogenase C-terminal domain-containing protein [Pontibacter sp. G13]
MKNILLIGAGRSATSLIQYLLKRCTETGWHLRVGDLSESLAREKIGETPVASAFRFDIFDEAQRDREIMDADLVISMLPAHFHSLPCQSCLKFGKHLLTASYVSDEIQLLDQQAREKGVLILMECGLDPGIDHMSAMRVLDQIRGAGHEINAFESFTGGLVAPQSCEGNPWEYKFTWNPRNVVLAGTGTVKFIQEGRYKYIPYHKVFRRTEIIELPEYGYFEGYANRDSLKYREVYGLESVETLYRGTLRRPGYCKTWDIFVQLGATDDSYKMEGVANMTHRQFLNSFLSYDPHNSVELKLAHYMKLDLDGQIMFRMKWLDLFEEIPVGLEEGTPAQILEHILQKKWKMEPQDQDMIVMWHKFLYEENGQMREIQSHMVIEGEDAQHTGMAKTVGLPLGIAADMILSGKIRETGVHIPVKPSIYNPILDELEKAGIKFVERQIS